MFLLSMLTFLYGLLCLFIILIVLIQKGKGNMGLGNMGGSNQMLFGSSGGQDTFQKITGVCCLILLVGSLVLAIIRGKQSFSSRSYRSRSEQSMPINQDIPSSDSVI